MFLFSFVVIEKQSVRFAVGNNVYRSQSKTVKCGGGNDCWDSPISCVVRCSLKVFVHTVLACFLALSLTMITHEKGETSLTIAHKWMAINLKLKWPAWCTTWALMPFRLMRKRNFYCCKTDWDKAAFVKSRFWRRTNNWARDIHKSIFVEHKISSHFFCEHFRILSRTVTKEFSQITLKENNLVTFATGWKPRHG